MRETPTQTVTERFRDYTDAAWNRGELDGLDGLFADDVVVHNDATGEVYEGLDAFKQWVTAVREGFPDFEVDMETAVFIVGEERVASHWSVSGTHEGRMAGIDVDPTHEHVEFWGTTIYEMGEGEVTEAWWYYDNLSFLDQLGLVPKELTA